MNVRAKVLGCATSVGVPIVGCPCDVCTSQDSRDVRTRSSIYLTVTSKDHADLYLLIDTGPDLRQQLLREQITAVDAVLYTHVHADHIFGLDDLRPIHFFHKPVIPIYGRSDHLDRIRSIYDYAFHDGEPAVGPVPTLVTNPISDQFMVDTVAIQAIPINHGDDIIFGYRIGNFAYLTDCSGIPETSLELLDGVTTIVLGALRDRPHIKHFTVEEAVDHARQIKVDRLVLTHMGHELGYESLNQRLPDWAEPGYDGLVIDCS